jgi:hypothetical protein
LNRSAGSVILPLLLIIIIGATGAVAALYWYTLGPGTGVFQLSISDPVVYPASWSAFNVTINSIYFSSSSGGTWTPLILQIPAIFACGYITSTLSGQAGVQVPIPNCLRINLVQLLALNVAVPIATGVSAGNVYQIMFNVTSITLQISGQPVLPLLAPWTCPIWPQLVSGQLPPQPVCVGSPRFMSWIVTVPPPLYRTGRVLLTLAGNPSSVNILPFVGLPLWAPNPSNLGTLFPLAVPVANYF